MCPGVIVPSASQRHTVRGDTTRPSPLGHADTGAWPAHLATRQDTLIAVSAARVALSALWAARSAIKRLKNLDLAGPAEPC